MVAYTFPYLFFSVSTDRVGEGLSGDLGTKASFEGMPSGPKVLILDHPFYLFK